MRPLLAKLPSTDTPLGRALRTGAAGAMLLALWRLGLAACPIAVITGHPCPGCGLTRATAALIQGDLHESVRLHPLAPIVSPLVIGFVAYGALAYVRVGRWPATQGVAASRMVAAGLALWVLLLGVWIARFCGAFGGPVAV